MKAFGAELIIVPSERGQVTPDLIPRMMEKAKSLAEAGSTYATDQIYNADSLAGYRGIGAELLAQLGRPIDAFCAGVGTAGLLMGVSQELRKANPQVRVVALEPATSAVISGDGPGSHKPVDRVAS